ncbi:pyridoxamine 5'-phosphate oxidase family protein [Thalassospiraceae bacterium LMO-JJ14]|nr:pyridoxamine 5'-phosphate oxidase family protein [Thalassospiraceae bacterium LMO-JJ14]
MSAHLIESIEALEEIYHSPAEASLVKESTYVTEEYRRLIEASPFVALASVADEGIDCSPRGDLKGFVRIHDEKTLMIPDRRGNNRVDTLRNIVRDPRVALLFLIPGAGTTLRINGRAKLSIDPELLESFTEQGKPPRSVIVIDIDVIYFQCARAILRAKLWDPAEHEDPKSLPSPGDILAAQTKTRDDGGIDGEAYDAEWPGRAAKSLW